MRKTIKVVGFAAIGGALALLLPITAAAEPPPNCTTADVAGVAGGVSLSTSAYLFTHPEANAFFSGLEGQPREQIREKVRAYLEANPQTAAELRGIRQPLTDLRARCGVALPNESDALG